MPCGPRGSSSTPRHLGERPRSLTRRDLLERAAATPLILGRSSLRAEASPRKPPWFAEALVRMAQERACGVTILVPEDPATRLALARSLESIARERHGTHSYAIVAPRDDRPGLEAEVEVVELLLQAVYCVVPRAVVPSRAGETAVLLDPDGDRVSGRAVDFSADARFAEGMSDLLHGEGRLEARAAAARTGRVAALLDRFAAKPAPERPGDPSFRDDLWTLVDFVDREAPTYALARRRGEDPRFRALLVDVLRFAMYRRLEEKRSGAPFYPDERIPDPASRPTGQPPPIHGIRHRMRLDGTLPYGVIWESEWIDSCPTCGLGSFPPRSRKFLRFLTE